MEHKSSFNKQLRKENRFDFTEYVEKQKKRKRVRPRFISRIC